MAHLATASCLRLAIKVQGCAGIGKERLPARRAVVPQIPQQVLHDHRAAHGSVSERQPGKDTDLLLELRSVRRVERGVAAVVWPRREFIDQQRAGLVDEKFHAQHALVRKCLGDGQRCFARLRGERRGNARRNNGQIKNTVLVAVLRYRLQRGTAVISSRKYRCEIGNRSAIIERLARNEDNLTVMSMPPRGMDIVSHPFAENPLIIVAPRGHALARSRRIPLSRLAGEPFLMREQGSGTRLAADRFLRERGIRLNVKMEIGSNEAIKQAVAGGLKLSLLSVHTLGPDAAPRSIVALNVEGLPIRRHWYIVHPAGKRLSVIAQTFFAYLKVENSRIKFPMLAGFTPHAGTVQRA